MNDNTLITPRYNFAQVFGLMWLSPFILLILIAFEEPYRSEGFMLAAFVIIFPILLGFYYRAKMVKYAIGFYGFFILMGCISNFQASLDKGMEDIYSLLYSVSVFLFVIGVVLLTFNRSTTIELNRKRHEAIDYADTFAQYNIQSSTMGLSTINPLYLLALMLLAPAIQFSNYFFENGFTHINSEGIVVLGFMLGFVGCSVGLFLKQKWSRPLFVILLGGLFFYFLYQYSINPKDDNITNTLLGMGLNLSPVFISLILLIYHPIIDYFFTSPTHLASDYDRILDLE